MARLWKWSLLSVVAVLLFVGCSAEVVQGNSHEQRGEYWLAYDQYLCAVAKNPGDIAATAGLRRTANLAAAHWEAKAFEAATQRNWDAAGEYHMKVLKIKPNESSSVLSLRQIAHYRSEPNGFEQPVLALDVRQTEHVPAPRRDEVRLAGELSAFRNATVRMSKIERPADQMHQEHAPATDIIEQPAFVVASAGDLPDLAEAVMPFTQPQQDVITLAVFQPDADAATNGPVAHQPASIANPAPTPEPVVLGVAPAPASDLVAPAPGPVVAEVAAVPADIPEPQPQPVAQLPAPATEASPAPATAVAVAVAPKPAIEQKPPKFADTFTKQFSIKLEGKRYQRRMYFDNGLTVQLSDTDMSPPDVDLEIHLNGRFLASHMDLAAGSVVVAHDKRGEKYEIGIVAIEDAGQTVIFGIRRQATDTITQLAGK